MGIKAKPKGGMGGGSMSMSGTSFGTGAGDAMSGNAFTTGNAMFNGM
jgi:hypothetical protein